jgi:hypothetical protein
VSWATGPFLGACVLLAWAGAAKVVRPAPARTAFRAIGLPSSVAAVRALGGVEVAIALAGMLLGRVAALTGRGTLRPIDSPGHAA